MASFTFGQGNLKHDASRDPNGKWRRNDTPAQRSRLSGPVILAFLEVAHLRSSLKVAEASDVPTRKREGTKCDQSPCPPLAHLAGRDRMSSLYFYVK